MAGLTMVWDLRARSTVGGPTAAVAYLRP
jgi:hypothetical protein